MSDNSKGNLYLVVIIISVSLMTTIHDEILLTTSTVKIWEIQTGVRKREHITVAFQQNVNATESVSKIQTESSPLEIPADKYLRSFLLFKMFGKLLEIHSLCHN